MRGATKGVVSLLGERLWQLVDDYSSRGDHRTGTAGDRMTRRWFREQCALRGATVQELEYVFDRYEARWRVSVDGVAVPAIPLYYHGTGTVWTRSPFVGEFRCRANVVGEDLPERLEEAATSGASCAVLASTGAGGRLVALNRPPGPSGPQPVLLVAESAFVRGPSGRIGEGQTVEVEVVAGLEQDISADVLAWFGPGPSPGADARPFVVTTPLTGWFCAAGERGTGVAAALELATALAERRPVLIVATTGHEIGEIGARAWLGGTHPWGVHHPSAVVHVGASFAAGEADADGVLQFATQRFAATNAGPRIAERFGEFAREMGMQYHPGSSRWLGEAALWAPRGSALLSFAGTFPLLHTAEDVPEASTSPNLLERATEALIGAATLVASDTGE